MPAVVCTDPDEAAAAVAAGSDVVLLTPVAITAGGPGPGRLAVFLGDPASPEDRAAAAEMAAEVFARG